MDAQEEFSLSQEDFTAKAATKSYLAKPGRNPFLIDEPTVISFSGGRTSAYMLWRVLEANGGLPEDAIVCFANTGKEEEATLEFVRDCEVNWGVEIHWLEYRNADPVFQKVDFKTASRNGEPYTALIQRYQPALPNGRARYCSDYLKTRTTHNYLKSIGWDEWKSFLGIRADEPRRVGKFRANPHPKGLYELVCLPLAEIGVSSKVVGEFWREQSFDLGLPNINGKTMHGNCDLCFLKPKAQILSLIKEKPEKAIWWINHEKEAAKRCSGDGKYFAIDRPSYEQMLSFASSQVDMFDQNEEGVACFCGD
jgi:3'-phosphoadenosine 5'-phosphosulfate sulfotransferase (PAPS reductase)/FAD synthetase